MIQHLIYVPFTGLGLYGGYRGDNWLQNRIIVFKRFVVPSLKAQTNQNFDIWVSWRPEEKSNPQVKELFQYLSQEFPNRVIFTYSGVCFWDDKYKPEEARARLLMNLHNTSRELVNFVTGHQVIMTIQPSDDCYRKTMVQEIQNILKPELGIQATGFRQGYIMNYNTGEIKEYNPLTIPPFFSIIFPREKFIDPYQHAEYTGPYESHEYIAKKLKFVDIWSRGFLVGTHGENISTHYNHPFGGTETDVTIKENFGIMGVEPIKLQYSLWRRLLKRLPYKVQRKLRYLVGEKIYPKIRKLAI